MSTQYRAFQHSSTFTQHISTGTQYFSTVKQHFSSGTQHFSTVTQCFSTGTQYSSTVTQHFSSGTQHSNTVSQHCIAAFQHRNTVSQHSNAAAPPFYCRPSFSLMQRLLVSLCPIPLSGECKEKVCDLGLARTVYTHRFDRTFGDFPAKNTVYTHRS